MQSRALALLAALAPFLGGCALTFQGTSQTLEFVTDPPGATFTGGRQTFTQPASVALAKGDAKVTFSKFGYFDADVELRTVTSPWFYASLVSGLLASSIDLLSGAWIEFEKTRIEVTLQPTGEIPVERSVTIRSE